MIKIRSGCNKIWLEVFIPRLPVRTSPPWEGLGEAPWGCSSPSSFYCSRRDAADGMPVMALVLIFVSPHSQLRVRVFDAGGFLLHHYFRGLTALTLDVNAR